jgi:Caspase domain
MRRLSLALFALALVTFGATSTAQEPARFALLIGNQGYNEKVGPLRTPHNDIALIGAALNSLNFKVVEVKDADYRSIDAAIKKHVQSVRRAGPGAISFVYYSGHGAADPETKVNYLIPVDVANADNEDLWNYSLNLNNVVDGLRVQAPQAIHYVIFDACRNELNLTRKGQKALTDKGFVPIASSAGVMIAYATAPGHTASDFGETSGPYARTLAEEIVKPGIEAVTMFRNVQLKVKQAIGQDPWLSFPTLPAVYLAGTKPLMPTPEQQMEMAFWASVKDSTSPAVLATYLERYPKGEFAPIARALIEHYERQLKAQLAAREEEQKREEEARKAVEVKRLEVERRARETALAEESLRAKQAKDDAETKRLEEQQRAEWAVRSEELRKALEEVSILREATKAAEEQRLAAVKAAEDAKKAADEVIALKRDTMKTDPSKVAALPSIESPQAVGPFDGFWSITRTANPGKCKVKSHTYTIRITNEAISGQVRNGTLSGKISASGAARWIVPAMADGAPTRFEGSFRGDSGSGRFTRTTDDRCSGSFTAKRAQVP